MPVFDVVSVEPETRPWTGAHGSFVSYYCVLRGEDGNPQKVEWARKATNSAPSPGETVAGHIESTNYGLKFKLDGPATKQLREQLRAEQYIPQTPMAPSQPIPPAQITGSPVVPSPKDQAIARMAAQKVAALFVLAQAQAGQAQQLSPGYVAQVADFFEQDARR